MLGLANASMNRVKKKIDFDIARVLWGSVKCASLVYYFVLKVGELFPHGIC